MKKIRVALIGFGGIARIHNNAYRQLEREGYPVRLVAVCEKNVESVRRSVTINLGNDTEALADSVRVYADADELLKNEEFDLADICLPTFLHKDMSIKFLNEGKHVICEKPMALSSSDCAEMVSAARENRLRLMIGQCLRFDHCYLYLKKCFEEKPFGELKHMTMHRLSEYPRWSPAFADLERTGGCILDTHIHDIDVARMIFGEPKSVSALAYNKMPFCQVVNSRLDYEGFSVIADCCWDESREKPFEAGFRAIFEEATVVCDGEKIKIFMNGKEPYIEELVPTDRIKDEIVEICRLIFDEGADDSQNPPESACESVKLIERLKESASLGGKQIVL